jgi:autotransporter-associated beta strand protein
MMLTLRVGPLFSLLCHRHIHKSQTSKYMKASLPLPSSLSLLRTTALAIAFGLGSAYAADQTWTNSASDSLWNASSTNWSGSTWTAGNNAIFGATGAGAITVNGTQSVGNMTFSAAGYGLTGGTLSFANTAASNAINIGAANMTISSGLSAAFASANGSLVKSGAGKLTLNGDMSLTAASSGTGLFDFSAGTTEISGGTINTTDVRMRTLVANGLTISGGTFNLGGTNAGRGINIGGGSGSIAVSGGTVNTNNLVIGQGSAGTLNISGGEVNMTGAGTYVLLGNGAAATLNLNGGTLATNRILRAGGTSVTESTINLNGGTLKALSNQTTTGLFSVLSGNGTMAVNVQAGGAIINSNTFNVKIDNVLNGAGGLTKNGTGSLELTKDNGFTGASAVNAGTLLLSGNATINAVSGLAVAAGATFTNNSSVSFTRNLTLTEGAAAAGSTINGSGTFAAGNMTIGSNFSDGFSTFALGTTAFTKAGRLDLNLTNTTSGNYTLFSGSNIGGAFSSLYINGFQLTKNGSDFSGNNGGFGYTFTNTSNLLAVVPEPTTWALLLGSLATAMLLRRRRNG